MQIPSGVKAIELQAICTDYSSPAQAITLQALEAPTSNGAFTLVAGSSNTGGNLDENTGVLENRCSFRYSVDPSEWGKWAKAHLVTTGAITFKVDLIITT